MPDWLITAWDWWQPIAPYWFFFCLGTLVGMLFGSWYIRRFAKLNHKLIAELQHQSQLNSLIIYRLGQMGIGITVERLADNHTSIRVDAHFDVNGRLVAPDHEQPTVKH